jgi:hypothetical protein
MFTQLVENFRKASESSLQAQREMFKQWVQQWPAASFKPMQAPGEWNGGLQKRWSESAMAALDKQRELFDATYKSGIKVIEQSFRVSEAKSPDEYRELVGELWRKLSETLTAQYEQQFHEFQSAAAKWAELTRSTNSPGASEPASAQAGR